MTPADPLDSDVHPFAEVRAGDEHDERPDAGDTVTLASEVFDFDGVLLSDLDRGAVSVRRDSDRDLPEDK